MSSSSRLSVLLAILVSSAAVAVEAPFRSRSDLEEHKKRIETRIREARRPSEDAAVLDVVKSFGVPDDGVRDAAGPLNKAIAAAEGKALYVPPGTYLLKSSMTPISGTRLYLANDAEMRRGFDGPNVGTRGALVQGDASGKTENVILSGGHWTNPEHKFAGRVFGIVGKKWTIESLRVSSWGTSEKASICMSIVGDDITVRNVSISGSAKRLGQAGIRVLAGDGIRISDGYVEAGDDAFCAFPVEAARQHQAGRGISNVTFERCHGLSFHARFLACGLTAVNSMRKREVKAEDLNKVRVSQIRFTDCEGLSLSEKSHGPAFFVICANAAAGAAVKDVKFLRCVGLASPASDQSVKVSCLKGAVCTDVTFEDCVISGGRTEAITVGRSCRNVVLKDCLVNGTRQSKSW